MELGLGAGATAGCTARARDTVVQVKELNAAFRASYQQIVFSPPAQGSDRQKSRQSDRQLHQKQQKQKGQRRKKIKGQTERREKERDKGTGRRETCLKKETKWKSKKDKGKREKGKKRKGEKGKYWK